MKMLGLVTLYHSKKEEALNNIEQYAPYIDQLIVWDNSPICHKEWFDINTIVYHWTGENKGIAPAMNYAWHYAEERGYHSFLVMDEDSRWEDFPEYRKAVETRFCQGQLDVFTPYIKGTDTFKAETEEYEKRLFINSGMVMPVEIFRAIGGADENAFPLDALDHDIALSIIEHGYRALCLTKHQLNHSLGQPQLMGPFHLFTPNYNRYRTYSMTRSHIICYRKHREMMTEEDRDYLFNEIICRKFYRIVLAEPDKIRRLIALVQGIISGYRYKISN